MRLDEFLALRLTALSRLGIRRLCRENAAQVNGLARPGGYRLQTGETVSLNLDEIPPNAMTPEPLPLEIVHETDSYLLVNKPAGMLAHPTLNVKSGTLLNGLIHYLNRNHAAPFIRPGLAHRLDRETSGLLIVAKTQRALKILTQHFQNRRVEKLYLALLHGLVQEDELLIDAPIGRDESMRPFWRVSDTGRPAQTRLRVLERKDGYTFAELAPITGRTNQLRIHAAHIGHPIAGDTLHGSAETTWPRLCLHATRLTFHDPDTNELLTFNSPWPDGLNTK